MADFSCGDEDAVPDDLSTSLDAEGDFDVVPEPADLVPASEDESEPDPQVDSVPSDPVEDPDPVPSDSDDDPVSVPLRKSVRFTRAPKVFTYPSIGGPPELIDVQIPTS